MNNNISKLISMSFVIKAMCFVLCTHFLIIQTEFSYNESILQNSTFQITQSGHYTFTNKKPYTFSPINIVASNPMIKITASDVVIDFNNIGITNTDTNHSGWTAIEIGWSPQEIIDDNTRKQPKNITLKNVSLYNFDCGIMMHHGTEGVIIENFKCYHTLVGIAVLGTATQKCQDILMQNITIYGLGENYHDALVSFKNLIETTYGYGANSFMPLQADTLNNDTVDAHTYFGLCINHVKKISLQNTEIQNIGYQNYENNSEGNGNRSESIGMLVKNSQRISLSKTTISGITSEIKAVALQLDNNDEVEIHDSDFSYCKSKVKSVGIEVTNKTSLDYSVSALQLENVSARTNISDDIAMGMDLSNVRGFSGINVINKFNQGDKQAYGIYSTKMYTADLKDSTLSENIATRTTNDVATTLGIVAAAFYGENINTMQVFNSHFSSVQALNSAFGIYLGAVLDNTLLFI